MRPSCICKCDICQIVLKSSQSYHFYRFDFCVSVCVCTFEGTGKKPREVHVRNSPVIKTLVVSISTLKWTMHQGHHFYHANFSLWAFISNRICIFTQYKIRSSHLAFSDPLMDRAWTSCNGVMNDFSNVSASREISIGIEQSHAYSSTCCTTILPALLSHFISPSEFPFPVMFRYALSLSGHSAYSTLGSGTSITSFSFLL